MSTRREFLWLAGGGLLLAASGCAKSGWPEGMVEIKWDRDTCTRCAMLISDRRFAAQARVGDKSHNFDDIGCAVSWLADQKIDLSATRLWVAEVMSQDNALWLDAKTAHYITRTSPMHYNQGAVAQAQAGSLVFAEMREHVLARGK